MTQYNTLRVVWIDSEREPKCKPNPLYPEGRDIDASDGAEQTCFTRLPCPAPRCGLFYVACDLCGTNAMITTAGRVDDPRSVKLRCQLGGKR